MKRMKKSVLLIIAILAICPMLIAEAGVVKKNNSLVVDGQLNSTDWFDAEDSTYVESGKLVIADSTGDTRVISKVIATADDIYQNMAVMTGKLEFSTLPQNEKFMIALGLDSVDAHSREEGNIEIEFTNNGGIQLSVTVYDDNGEAKVLAAPKNIGTKEGGTVSFSVTATTDQKLNVSINGNSVCSLSGLEDLEGRIGFLQTGKSNVKISECSANFTQYDRPENTNAFEDFETEIYNYNLFTTNIISNVRVPAKLAVQEMDGSNVLMFQNTKLCYFGTRHSYSNFELTFDVPYYLRNSVKDEYGRTVGVPTQEFLVSVGDEAVDFNGYGYAKSVEAIRVTKNTVHGYHKPEKFRVNYANAGYVDATSNDGFSMLVRMVDGHMSVGIKKLEATKFDIIAEADYEDFRSGFVKIWSVNDGNFAIDNFKITNLDDKGRLVDVEFAGATIVQEDFDYQPSKLEFRPIDASADAGAKLSNRMLIGMTMLGCVVIIGVGFGIAAVLKKKGKQDVKEAAGNEME